MGRGARVLITGGGGFVGARLVRACLAAGDDVALIVRPESNPWRLADVLAQLMVFRVDLRDSAAVGRAVAASAPEIIYHLAAHGVYPRQQERAEMLTTNVLGLANLLDALTDRDYRAFIHAGTGAEYGPVARPIRESARLAPRTDYAVAKAAGYLLSQAEAWRGRPVTTIRTFCCYGPGEEATRLVPYVMGCCVRGESPRVSAGQQVRDFIHVDDVAALFRMAARAERSRGGVLHAGTGLPCSVAEMVNTILEVAGSPCAAEFGAQPLRPGEPSYYVADIRRTTRLTGWRPRFDLRSGVEATWSWFRTSQLHAA
jgi:nucleoside-diphosphate-sugar epimerase